MGRSDCCSCKFLVFTNAGFIPVELVLKTPDPLILIHLIATYPQKKYIHIMNFDLAKAATFGVAGNFTGHLEQAGEAVDFTNIKTAEQNEPKAIFPTYIPLPDAAKNKENIIPDFLTVFPFSTSKIIYPKGEQKIQLEPECAIIFDAVWNNDKIKQLIPLSFGASNDCSIRKAGAAKISQKKNWGANSKGLSEHLIAIDSFTSNGILNKYRIASFMIRNGEVFSYGEDSAIRDYSYIYKKLIDWMINKLNTQKNEGPAENINSYLTAAGCPQKIMISIGATRYTEFGKTNFLNDGDVSVVILYPEDKYSFEQIKSKLEQNENFESDVSVLYQTVTV